MAGFGISLVPLLAVSLHGPPSGAGRRSPRLLSQARSFKDLRFAVVDWVVMAGLLLLAAAGIAAMVLGYGTAQGGMK